MWLLGVVTVVAKGGVDVPVWESLGEEGEQKVIDVVKFRPRLIPDIVRRIITCTHTHTHTHTSLKAYVSARKFAS